MLFSRPPLGVSRRAMHDVSRGARACAGNENATGHSHSRNTAVILIAHNFHRLARMKVKSLRGASPLHQTALWNIT